MSLNINNSTMSSLGESPSPLTAISKGNKHIAEEFRKSIKGRAMLSSYGQTKPLTPANKMLSAHLVKDLSIQMNAGLLSAESLKQIVEQNKTIISEGLGIAQVNKDAKGATKNFGDEYYVEETIGTVGNPTSFYRMWMGGDQHAHAHDFGTRQLILRSHEPWFFYAGGTRSNESLEADGLERQWVKMEIPAGETILSMPKGFYHKFLSQNGLAGFSIHIFDAKEVADSKGIKGPEDVIKILESIQSKLLSREDTRKSNQVREYLDKEVIKCMEKQKQDNESIMSLEESGNLMDALTTWDKKDALITNGNILGSAPVKLADVVPYMIDSSVKTYDLGSRKLLENVISNSSKVRA